MAAGRLGLVFAVVIVCAGWRGAGAEPVDDLVLEQHGKASYYHDKFDGRRTASGEVFDQAALTAASPSLPLGTQVTVTNVENGRSVDVRVNDRGPFVAGRVIDLTGAAAEKLDMKQDGVTKVKIVAKPSAQPSEALKAKVRQKAAQKAVAAKKKPAPQHLAAN